jgi:CubicO group peptidase (beta-lactamase class C family)
VGASIRSGLEHAVELGEIGLQVAAYHRGQLIVDEWIGYADDTARPVEGDTLFPVFSVSKAITATALHLQAERGLVDYEEKVATYWPEYAANGKGSTTVRDALTHRAGIPHMPEGVTPELMADWDWMVEQVAGHTPMFPPGTSAYHSLVWGWIIGEVVRRTDPQHRPFGQFVRDELCAPLGIEDLWMGAPDEVLGRIAVLFWDGQLPPGEGTGIGLLTRPSAVAPVASVHNKRVVLQACVPGAGVVMSARAGARFFAMLANGGELDGVRLLSEDRLRALAQPRSNPDEIDGVLIGGGRIPAAIGCGGYWIEGALAQLPTTLLCHGGAGGSVGLADLDRRVSVSVCHNRMFNAQGGGPNPFSLIGDAIWQQVSEGQRL